MAGCSTNTGITVQGSGNDKIDLHIMITESNLIHVAGNAVLDLLVRDVSPGDGQAVEAWGRGSVHFLDRPVEPALGGAAATTYLLGRLGERVSLNTQVGDDALGAILKSWLAEAGIALVVPAAGSTAANVLFVAPDGTPRWHYYTGQKVDWRRSLAVTDAAWFYASGYGQTTGTDLAELCEVFKVFRSRGTRIAFDPGPWLFAHASREQMVQSWAQVDCLIGTESELSTWHAGKSVTELIGRLLTLGPQQVVVKRGADGAAFGEAGAGVYSLPTDRVENANAVGAGDTFNAALLDSLNRGTTLDEAVETAVRLATGAVKRGKGVLGALA